MAEIKTDILIRQATKAIHRQDYDKALELSRKALGLKPFDPTARALIDFILTDRLPPNFLI